MSLSTWSTTGRPCRRCAPPRRPIFRATISLKVSCCGTAALAVLPASHHVSLPDLRAQLGEDTTLASEHEIGQVFRDCASGAVPALGTCYGLKTIIDDKLAEQPEVYLEAGDHATLIHMSQADFARLTAAARHGRFSVH